MEKIEEWKQISDFPKYEVSNKGGIRIKESGYIMKQFKNAAGYFRISLKNDVIKRKKLYVHRIVAKEFISNPENKPTVNHINNIRTDNRINNLEWSTMSEQALHKIKTNNTFEKKINIKSIWRLDINTHAKLEKYESTTYAVRWLKSNNLTNAKNELTLRQSLINVSKGKNNSAYGYKWKYDDDTLINYPDEIWKEVPVEVFKVSGIFVSNYGRIKNSHDELYKYKMNCHGYMKITINKINIGVHRIVALTFLINDKNKEFINHIDGNKINNKLDNLEWATCLENNLHKIKSGLSNTTKKVAQYDKNMIKINEFISIKEAANYLNVSPNTISRSCNGITKCMNKGYYFKFI